MGQKMITIPFDVELAKKIQAGEHPGKIITEEGKAEARVIEWDGRNFNYPITAAIDINGGGELPYHYDKYGEHIADKNMNLVLQVPEWVKYKEGDVLAHKDGGIFILKKFEYCDISCIRNKYFVALGEGIGLYFENREEEYYSYAAEISGYATEDQKQYFINSLKASTDPRAKECLKRFFGIEETEEKPECEFEPFQKVLVRDGRDDKWSCDLFSNFDAEDAQFVCVGGYSTYCIPYNDQTKYLLGTTNNWEE